MITEFKKPLLFDCGSVGLRVPVSEFFKSTKAACIEGLGKVEASSPESAKTAVQKVEAKIVEAAARPASPEGSPEPAPEPGPAGSAEICTEAMEALWLTEANLCTVWAMFAEARTLLRKALF